MEQLLEGLDSTIFTPELKAEIQAKFASKIADIEDEYNAKLDEANAKIESLETEKEEIIEHAENYSSELIKHADDYTARELAEQAKKAQEYGDLIAEEYKARAVEYTDYLKEELSKTVSSYLDTVVEEYIKENRIVIDESIEIQKTKSILEGLDSIIQVAGISVIELQESVKKPESEDKIIVDLKAKVDALVKENTGLKNEAKIKEQETILESVAKDLTLVERDRFDRLSKMVAFKEANVYRVSLEKIKEEITNRVEETVVTKQPEESKQINEKSYSRFI